MNIKNIFPWVLTFEHLLTKTEFVNHMIDMLAILNNAYKHAVDVEFTVNFFNKTDFRINLLQCRPFQFSGKMKQVNLPENLKTEDIILETSGPLSARILSRPLIPLFMYSRIHTGK